ncbi:MAG TPA: bifunctional phosphoribosylaminoimidazolecarboxamide formyltransferase/IMP cyclohydrolase [Limnochordia bacterium]|nr:bifunctional phosphoribosylaminoimidazolecarboxamide formyltransferase/IMP cyclohydrolase [Limnochordia bacterium]
MKLALLSVYDKTGVAAFAQSLVENGYKLISTGGTYRLLKENNLPVTYISEVTEFPEILDGRVKTLHPRVHGGILAKDTDEHRRQLEQIGGSLIDLVAVNLYPFEAVSQDPNATEEQVVENIDIGGPTLLRAAAKNHARVVVVSDPKDYDWVLEKMKEGSLDLDDRKRLAAKAFNHTAYYDTLIAHYLGQPVFADKMTVALEKAANLRYGENPHQKAAFYRQAPVWPVSIAQAQQLHGKELSFNNIYDAQAAWQLVSEFQEPCAVAVKHNNPCGLAVGESLYEAYLKAYEGDPVSIFGGIVAVNRKVDVPTAKEMSKIFLEVIIAPDFTEDALAVLTKKANLRLLKLEPAQSSDWDWKKVSGGFLIQEADVVDLDHNQLKVVTNRQPSDEEWEDLFFGWKVVKYVKSNAIVLCKAKQLIGVGAGQMNRVQSVRLSVEQAGDQAKGAVLASDAFFPFADSVELAASKGVTAIIQPGGSVRDQEVIDACNQHGMAMVFTGIRHFRH